MLMERMYQRNLNRSYMILEGSDVVENFEAKMLSQNKIAVLLSFYTVKADGRVQYWYDITGMRSLKDYVEQEGLEIQTIYQIVLYLSIAMDEINKHLLSQNHLVISPDTVFVDRSRSESLLKICYCASADEDFSAAVLSILEMFLSEVDHRKEEVTKLCYELYQMVAEEEFRFEDLLEQIHTYQVEPEVEAEAEAVVRDSEIEYSMGDNRRGKDERGRFPDTLPDARSEERRDVRSNPQAVLFDDDPEADVLSFLVDEKSEKSSRRQKKVHRDKKGKQKERKNRERRSIFQRKQKDSKEKKLSFSLRPKFEQKFRNDRLEKPEDFIYDPTNDYEEPTMLLSRAEQGVGTVRLCYLGEEKEDDFVIRKENFRIGSSEKDNDGVIRSRVVSRHHARIFRKGSAVYLEDLNSRNGTFLNGKILNYGTPVLIQETDRIQFADQEYQVSISFRG